MRNIIGGDHIIDSTHWVLSIVRRLGDEEDGLIATGNHSFLVLEGATPEGERITKEAHLGYRMLEGNRHDKTKAQIYYLDCLPSKLHHLATDKYVKKTWSISLEEKNQVINRILHDEQYCENNDVPYSFLGKTKTAGRWGASLDNVGSTNLKNQSINGITSLAESKNSCSKASYHLAESMLRSGHNCTSWAKDVVRMVRPDFKKSILEKYVAVIPENAIPASDTSSSCRLL